MSPRRAGLRTLFVFQVIRSSIVGLGTDEESLTRAEVDMKKVKEYKVRYR